MGRRMLAPALLSMNSTAAVSSAQAAGSASMTGSFLVDSFWTWRWGLIGKHFT
jgi:hypothetical protein